MCSQDEMDNHANQLNPNNYAYWQSRGYDERPDYWDDDDDLPNAKDDYDDRFYDEDDDYCDVDPCCDWDW